jgi:hypothetical protein
MARIFFIGGENVTKRDAKEANALAFQSAGNSPNVLVFSWARPSFDARYLRRKRFTDYVISLGAGSVAFADYSDSADVLGSLLNDSGLIYLTGGQVSVLLSRLRVKSVDNLLNEYHGVVVGRSSGAVVLGKRCLVTNRYSGKPAVVNGLELVDFSVKAHYEPSKDKLLKELSKKGPVYAIPQGSALAYDEGTLFFIGDVFLFESGEKKLCRQR